MGLRLYNIFRDLGALTWSQTVATPLSPNLQPRLLAVGMLDGKLKLVLVKFNMDEAAKSSATRPGGKIYLDHSFKEDTAQAQEEDFGRWEPHGD